MAQPIVLPIVIIPYHGAATISKCTCVVAYCAIPNPHTIHYVLVEFFGVVNITVAIWRKGVDICATRVFVGHKIELSVIAIQTQVAPDTLTCVQTISCDEPRNITHVDERKLLTIAQLLITAYGIALFVCPCVVGKETVKGFVIWSKHSKRVKATHVFAFIVGDLVLERALYATKRVNQAQIGGVVT